MQNQKTMIESSISPDGIIGREWLSINDANSVSGFSKYYLRSGCKDKSIPSITINGQYFINYPLFMEKLRASIKEVGVEQQ